MSFETIKDRDHLNSLFSRFQRNLRGINYNLSRLPPGPARNLDRLPASVSERLDPRMPLTQHLQRPCRTTYIEAKPTGKRQEVEFDRVKLRVEHRDLLSLTILLSPKPSKIKTLPLPYQTISLILTSNSGRRTWRTIHSVHLLQRLQPSSVVFGAVTR